jgi:hypothetical protein
VTPFRTDIHSILLALAIFLLALAIAALAAFPLSAGIQRRRAVPRWFPRAVLILLILALTFDGLSLIVHVLTGHRPGTSQAMGWQEFLAEHPAFLVVALFGLLAVVLLPRRPSP